MNEKFLSLPKEKQQKIINAGMEVFAKNEYKKASTDEIATKAGISKGLLFYYFKNKKTFYLFIYNYIIKIIEKEVLDKNFTYITDYFELMEYGAKKKIQVMKNNPYLYDFAVRSIYSNKDEVSEDLNNINAKLVANEIRYFKNVDFSKFKDEIDFREINEMIYYIFYGYLYQKKIINQPINIKELMGKYKKWKVFLKNSIYKEEYR